MYGEYPHIIDHINQNPHDNRIENLRQVSHKENGRNKALNSNNSTGVTGVYFNKDKNFYYSQIKVDGKVKHLGCFSTVKEAKKARQQANIVQQQQLPGHLFGGLGKM